MRIAVLLSVLALAACGADGDPAPVETGVSTSGEARIGVTGSL